MTAPITHPGLLYVQQHYEALVGAFERGDVEPQSVKQQMQQIAVYYKGFDWTIFEGHWQRSEHHSHKNWTTDDPSLYAGKPDPTKPRWPLPSKTAILRSLVVAAIALLMWHHYFPSAASSEGLGGNGSPDPIQSTEA